MKAAGSRESCLANLGIPNFDEVSRLLPNFVIVRDATEAFLEENKYKGYKLKELPWKC